MAIEHVDLTVLRELLRDVISHQNAWKAALLDQANWRGEIYDDDIADANSTYCKHEQGIVDRLVAQAYQVMHALNK
jgi:hypothetical protein